MKISKLKLTPLIAAVSLACAGSVAAAPVIGINPLGTGFSAGACALAGCFYASNWTDIVDTGQNIGSITTIGAPHTFTTQAAIGATTNNGVPTTPSLLNVNTTAGFEVTKEIKFNDVVTDITGPGGSTITFGFAPQTLATNFSLYLDHLGDGTQAVRAAPGASCYGDGVGCPGIGDGIGGDGVLILTAQLIANNAAFTASAPGVGNGSFQVTFQITSSLAGYIDLSDLPLNGGDGLPIFTDILTGTLVQPANAATLGFTPPTQMWDGTAFISNSVGANAFKVDGSETFAVAAIPEPTTVALLGIGLAALGFTSRKKQV